MKTTETDRTSESLPDSAAAGLPNTPPTRSLRVWIVDDHASLRETFAEALNRRPGIQCTRAFSSGAAILATLEEERPPDLILLDINLGRETGLSFIRPIKKLAPTVKVVMFTTFKNIHYEGEAFKAGASGFVLKTGRMEDIVRLIRKAGGDAGSPELFPNKSRYTGLAPFFREESLGDGRQPFGVISALRQFVRT